MQKTAQAFVWAVFVYKLKLKPIRDHMLVLSRKREQQIIIDENIHIKVVEIGRDYVRLGITAPKEIPIYREELILKGKPYNDKSTADP